MVDFLARILPRWLAIALRIRRVVPVDGYWPRRSVVVPELDDTGGGFRASWRQQDPSVDPREPGGGESSSAGSDHGWSNCSMTSGALVLAYQQPRGSKAPWGGDLRHSGQPDLSGGTDLYDVKAAWSEYGETLTIKSGAGWSAVKTAHSEGRAIVIQGTGNVPGSESFDGGHACAIAPETHSDGRWLFGDPLASGWQWIKPADIEAWAERWQSSVAFAVGEKPPTDPPKPPPVVVLELVVPPGPELQKATALGGQMALDAEVEVWVVWIDAAGSGPGGRWDDSRWEPATARELDELEEDCEPTGVAVWGRGPVPDPAQAARHALTSEPTWDVDGSWSASLWR